VASDLSRWRVLSGGSDLLRLWELPGVHTYRGFPDIPEVSPDIPLADVQAALVEALEHGQRRDRSRRVEALFEQIGNETSHVPRVSGRPNASWELAEGGSSTEERRLQVEYGDVPTIFTIGYEQHRTPSTLIDALRAAGVRRLVDVRELPLSRRRGFSKTGLASFLAEAEIGYEHVRALGNPKPYRDLYKSGRINEGAGAYRAHLHNGSYPALIELSQTLDKTPTCLLCFEEAHDVCHRAEIVAALEDRLVDLDIVHLQ
jgi:hypothetical protein